MTWTWVGVCVLATWTCVSMNWVGANAGVAVSLGGAFVLGPLMSLTAVMTRETRFLPLTSRDVWVAAWTLSTIVTTVFVVALQAAGMGIGLAAGFPQPHAAASLLFSGLCAFAYGGALLPMGPLMGYTSHAAAERRPRWLWTTLAALTMLVYMGGLAMPWAAWSVLPVSFADLGWRSAVVLVLGIIAAFGARAWTPQRFGAMSRPTTRTGATPKAHSHRAQTSARPTTRDAIGFTGLNRLLLPTLMWTLVLAVASVGGATLFAASPYAPSGSLYEVFAGWGLLPFSAAGFSPKVIVNSALVVPFFAMSGGWAWDGYTRHLRVLPLSAAEATRLLLGTTMLMWAVVWVVLLGIHVVVLGLFPTTLRPELFMYLTGLTVLLEAVARTRKKNGGPFSLATIPVFLLVGLLEGFSGRFGPATLLWTHSIVGSAAFVIAGVVTYRSLTRSTSSAHVYKPAIPPFNA